MIDFQTPNRLEPVLADKEVLLTALNIKSMNFSEEEIPANGGASEVSDDGDSRPNGAPTSASQQQNNDNIVTQLLGGSSPGKLRGKGSTPIIVDLAFASNVRFLDDHELYLDNVELYRVRIKRVKQLFLGR